MEAAVQCAIDAQTTKQAHPRVDRIKGQGLGAGNNNDGEESDSSLEDHRQRSPNHTRRDRVERERDRQRLRCDTEGEEEEEEGESETDKGGMEGSPQQRRRSRAHPSLKACFHSLHNNDEDLQSSGEILANSSGLEEDSEDSEWPKEWQREAFAPASHLLIICDGPHGSSDSLLADSLEDFSESEEEGDSRLYCSAQGALDDEDWDDEEEEEESDFVPCSDDDLEDSLEYRSWTAEDEDNYDDELEAPPPFWFGHEETEHIKAIMKCYEDELVKTPAPNCRSFRPFIGRVARIVVTSGADFQTYDTVQICNNQRMEAGKAMPVERTVCLLTAWEAADGMPEEFQAVPDSCLEHWQSICAGKEPHFLFCEPSFFEANSFSFSGSLDCRDVGYASLPWQSTPFDAVVPHCSQDRLIDDVFPSDSDAPLAPCSDPNWAWLSGAA